MKKIFFLLAIGAAILGSACNKDLNQVPISSGTTVTFYKSPSDFIQGVNAIYADLRGYPDRLLFLSEVRSDNIYGVSVTVRDWDPINDFSPGIAPNTYVEEGWNTDFNGVFRANTVLDQLTKNGSNVGSAVLATRLQAEARYLRAFYYFDLVREFGNIPLITTVLQSDQFFNQVQVKPADVYAQIEKDLGDAIPNLPATVTTAENGRVTKGAAQALLGKAIIYENNTSRMQEAAAGSDYKLIRKRIDELNHATEHLAELLMNSAVSTALEGRKLAEV